MITSGRSSLSRATVSASGPAAFSRALSTSSLRTLAATRADWCQAVVELTTAIRLRCRSVARTPAHSLARA